MWNLQQAAWPAGDCSPCDPDFGTPVSVVFALAFKVIGALLMRVPAALLVHATVTGLRRGLCRMAGRMGDPTNQRWRYAVGSRGLPQRSALQG